MPVPPRAQTFKNLYSIDWIYITRMHQRINWKQNEHIKKRKGEEKGERGEAVRSY